MSQHRISIPYIYTKVYSDQEFKALVESAKEKTKWTGYVLLGLSLTAAEVITRHTTNGLQAAANAVADVHDQFAHKLEDRKLQHEWKRMAEARGTEVA